MSGKYDIVIIGAGAAGTSAALTALNRGKTVALVANGEGSGSLSKAEMVTNYPGLPDMSGRDISAAFERQLKNSGAAIIAGRALSVMPFGESFGVAVGNDFFEASAVIIAAGITREKLYPGEGEYLGRGVSYCATCDGMLYKGKRAAVIGSGEEAAHDAEFLRGICSELRHFTDAGAYEIKGGDKVTALVHKGEEYQVDAVFVIKDTVSVTKLLPGLEYAAGGIVTDRAMRTSVDGVYAAGDCTGKPYQLAKAVGEGNVAALSACEYIDAKRK